jgi:predicted site-specific integrase-resolvase
MMATTGEARTPNGKTVKGSFLYLREVADRIGVHPSTILRWVKEKKVKVTGYKDRRGYWVFREADLSKFESHARDIRPAT